VPLRCVEGVGWLCQRHTEKHLTAHMRERANCVPVAQSGLHTNFAPVLYSARKGSPPRCFNMPGLSRSGMFNTFIPLTNPLA
jgi:hypothetical protein